jgi:hypothetical protein
VKTRLQQELEKMIGDRKVALDNMHTEFDRADANNPFSQSTIAQVISELTESVEQLERFLKLVTYKRLK